MIQTDLPTQMTYNGKEIPLVQTGSTSSEEWQPNADMIWAKSVCENDVQFPSVNTLDDTNADVDWWEDEMTGNTGNNGEGATGGEPASSPYKVLEMLGDLFPTSDFDIPPLGAVKTSDGGYYENTSETDRLTVTHTWDDTYERVSESYQGRYNKVRWIIYYSAVQDLYSTYNITPTNDAIYICYDNVSLSDMGGALVEYIDFINNATSSDTCLNLFSLKAMPQLDTSNKTSFANYCQSCYALEKLQLDTSNGTNFNSMFNQCISLRKTPKLNTSSGTDFGAMFLECYLLENISQLDTSNGTTFSSMFSSCRLLKQTPELNTSSGTTFSSMFSNCYLLENISQLDTSNGTNFYNMFFSCRLLKTIPLLNLINATNVGSIFTSCRNLTNLTLKNIKISITIGSGTSWGHLLTLDSLTNTIKELWDNTGGSSTLTLTVGSANLTKLANVYVKLVDITDEMRAEDEYIDNKLPFVVCESTDEGAMLITEYVVNKGWQLA